MRREPVLEVQLLIKPEKPINRRPSNVGDEISLSLTSMLPKHPAHDRHRMRCKFTHIKDNLSFKNWQQMIIRQSISIEGEAMNSLAFLFILL